MVRRDKKIGKAYETSIGVGYASIVMIFVVLCLTSLAVLSLQTAVSVEMIEDKNRDFVEEYYLADSNAKRVLMKLDSAACKASGSLLFEDSFREAAGNDAGLADVMIKGTFAGVSATYSIEINDRSMLEVEVMFYENKQYEIKKWKTVAEETDTESKLGVWDGTF